MGHHGDVKLVPAFVASLIVMAACADTPTETKADTQGVAEIICEADGSTTILTPRVLVQPDGVHVHTVSHLDEPAEIIDLSHDVDPGETEWVSHTPPGTVETACNPFSQHDSGEAPPTVPVEILDPDGIYVTGEIQCSGTSSAGIGDFAEAPLDVGPVPLGEARAAIRGLDDDDQLLHAGYPKQRDASVIVRRHGQIVASFGFVTFDGQEWVIEGSQICTSSGLSYPY
jgi:hypothetical protein